MANTIILKKSTTAGAAPSAGSLQQGELAVNLVDKKLYVKDSTNNVVSLTVDVSPIYARVEKNTGQSFTTGTTTVSYQTVVEDASSLWDSSNNQFIVPAAANGKVAVITAEHQDSADGTTNAELWIERSQNSGSSWSRVAQSPNAGLDHFGIFSATAIIKVATGDWFRVRRVANESKTSAADLRCSFTFCTLNATKGDAGASGTPAGLTGAIQYNNAGALGGAANVDIDGGDLMLNANTSPTAPASGNVKLFGKTLASRVFPAFVGASNMDAAVQPSIWRQKVAFFNPPGNSNAAVTPVSMLSFTNTGTATVRSVAATNLMSRTRRIGYVTAATAGSLAGTYNGAAQYTTGDGSGLGGFFAAFRFAFSDPATVSGARTFVGMSSSTAAPANVEANSLTNSVGIAQLSTDATQLYIVYGGSAAQTAIALGTDFPPMAGSGSTNGTVYELTLYAPPSANGTIYYRVERVGTSFAAEGTLTPATPGTQTPLSTTFLAPRFWRSNNATAAVVGIDVINLYIETDY